MIVYLTEQGSRLVRRGELLCVLKGESTLHTLFTHRLRQLVICGNITLSPSTIAKLCRDGVETCFLRQDGRWVGRLSMAEPKNIHLRRLQFERCADAAFRLSASKNILEGKLANMATYLLRLRRLRKIQELGGAATAIHAVAAQLHGARDLSVCRGLEGHAAALYFQALRHGFLVDHGFRKRVRRPPTDPVNSVLSLLYTFAINRMYAAVRLAGLDPAPGVLHDAEYGRHSLPLDLVEEFRVLLADTLTLSLFNTGALKADDFIRVEPQASDSDDSDDTDAAVADPAGRLAPLESEEFDTPATSMDESRDRPGDGKLPVRLKPEAFKRVILAFEKKMESELHHPTTGEAMTYAEAMVFQARLFRRVVEGDAERYRPMRMR